MASNDGVQAAHPQETRSTADIALDEGEQTAVPQEDKIPAYCATCDITTEHLTTWAVPVKVEDLAANLEAYYDTFAARIAFTLCVRKSQERSFSALPLELIDKIFEYVVQDSRELPRSVWTARYSISTASGGAEALDYTRHWIMEDMPHNEAIIQKDLEEFRSYCRSCIGTIDWSDDDEDDGTIPLLKACYDCRACYKSENYAMNSHPHAADLAEHLSTNELWMEEQEHLAFDWFYEVIHERLLKPDWTDLLRKHFGLDVWVVVRKTQDFPLALITTAFLIPAETKPTRMQYDFLSSSGHKETDTYSSFVDLTELPKLTPAQASRFKRSMHKLSLSTCSGLERGTSNSIESRSSHQGPRLISLARTCHSLGDVEEK